MIRSIKRSLADILGEDYVEKLLENRAFLGYDKENDRRLAYEKVDFYPEEFAKRQEELIHYAGKKVVAPFVNGKIGAATKAYQAAAECGRSGMGTYGVFRVGEDGNLYVSSKAEHYHASLGHNFPGYRLLEYARRLGITTAAHNTARGYITRLLEEELIKTAGGISEHDKEGCERIKNSKEPGVLNRVLNLETGSLATEAAVKMMLARFYRYEEKMEEPVYADRIPVFLVIGDTAGGLGANYHGTTLFTQYLRGFWPEIAEKTQGAEAFKICPVGINDVADFREKMEQYNRPPYKTAGFLHEIVLMNYGAVLLEKDYLQAAYRLCRQYDTPVLCDEIQSCMWCEGMYLFREFDLHPDFVSIGKGFPGGTYASSRLLMTEPVDCLELFGALVTNGQNEISSLAYLITMEFAKANGNHITEIGNYLHEKTEEKLGKYDCFDEVTGKGLLMAVKLKDLDMIQKFGHAIAAYGYEVSVQSYKPHCPPVAITKLPVTISRALVDSFTDAMELAVRDIL
ncbi:MAG: aminotransferase class III-fold pyridoxal phosphate-dependent enzyme [Lachnospiraceae bacterium]|nr:aminotransferase class III-fold pyridoxal phosphate-dependent enzyme [Lachnospiraceae bacterium]